jgi:hypothetical protein
MESWIDGRRVRQTPAISGTPSSVTEATAPTSPLGAAVFDPPLIKTFRTSASAAEPSIDEATDLVIMAEIPKEPCSVKTYRTAGA